MNHSKWSYLFGLSNFLVLAFGLDVSAEHNSGLLCDLFAEPKLSLLDNIDILDELFFLVDYRSIGEFNFLQEEHNRVDGESMQNLKQRQLIQKIEFDSMLAFQQGSK